MRAEVKLDLRHTTIPELMECAQMVDMGLTGNPRFPDADALLTELRARRAAADQAIADYRDMQVTLQIKLSARDQAVQALGLTLRRTASYVDCTSAGDESAAMSSGFPLKHQPTPLGEPAQVSGLIVCQDRGEGCLRITWDLVRGANSYEVQLSTNPDDPTSWRTRLVATRCKATLSKLPSGTKMWVRVRAIGGKSNAGQWSQYVAKMVP